MQRPSRRNLKPQFRACSFFVEMGKAYCCVPGCSNDQRKLKNLSWHVFPKDKQRRRQWIVSIRRDPGKDFHISSYTTVCSAHFRPTDYRPLLHCKKKYLKDKAVPSVFFWNQNQKYAERSQRLERKKNLRVSAENWQDHVEKQQDQAAGAVQEVAVASTDVFTPESPTNEERKHEAAAALLELQATNALAHVSPKEIQLTKENTALKEEIGKLKRKIEKLEMCALPSVIQNDLNTVHYTGFPNYKTYKAVLQYFCVKAEKMKYWKGYTTNPSNSSLPKSVPRMLSLETEFLLVMVRLRLGVTNKELSRLFSVSETTVSFVFTTWLNFMFRELKLMFPLPSRKLIKANLPKSFSEFQNVILILDCTEVRVQRPSKLSLQKELYSNYKHYNTYKILIGITPDGLVCFLSSLHGGGSSDKQIVLSSTLLSLLQPGDAIMADKGFQIEDVLPEGVVLNVPPLFERRKNPQIPVNDVLKTRKIAAVRVHVERAIRRIKTYHILDTPLKSNMAQLAEQTFSVCAYLTNFHKALIK